MQPRHMQGDEGEALATHHVSPPTRIVYGAPELPADAPAAERFAHGLMAYFLDGPQFHSGLEPAGDTPAVPSHHSRKGDGTQHGMLARGHMQLHGSDAHVRYGVFVQEHMQPEGSGGPAQHSMHARDHMQLEGSHVPMQHSMHASEDLLREEDSSTAESPPAGTAPEEQHAGPGQPSIIIGDSNTSAADERWTALAAIVLNASMPFLDAQEAADHGCGQGPMGTEETSGMSTSMFWPISLDLRCYSYYCIFYGDKPYALRIHPYSSGRSHPQIIFQVV